jgi:murein L,D-transpeptidase YafK
VTVTRWTDMARCCLAVAFVAVAVFVPLSRSTAAPALAPVAERADRIVVEKSARRLFLMRGGAIVAEYFVALGAEPLGDKQQEGDERTPEGLYTIDYKNAESAYHLSLHISYPDGEDRAEAKRLGVSPGGDIMIHGLPNRFGFIGGLHRLMDWTDGCIAVTNDEIEEIWAKVAVGTPIEIKE